MQYGRRGVAGVKPPRLLQTADRTPGEHFFVPERTLDEIAQTVTCHELTHVFTYHLRLATWLREGLATLAMEHYLGRRIVRTDTLDQLALAPPAYGDRVRGTQGLDQRQALITQYVRGYWLTRLIEEDRPDLLQDLLVERLAGKALEKMIAAAFGKDPGRFWKDIDAQLQSRYARATGPSAEDIQERHAD